ncbi:NAD-dependent epimerase/dehydratase family protein [Uliginosibacterium sp. H1]|uniref:NAD-dependent epimerase/dehydratase family protein n=1 Tax=Uliginosibacterium sp. H1 TaxID=3114757 RepID=UPI002E19F835|nr:vitamin K epoxide reductase family protein [Uliginosibacterium sp. H1]
MPASKPIVIITGAAGDIGSALSAALAASFQVVGLDRKTDTGIVAVDLAAADSVTAALAGIRAGHGKRIAAVVHLAAFFDFTGEDNPLYEQVNVQGTRHMLDALQGFEVERFIYASTMLVHRAGEPGDVIREDTPIEPGWAYPASKARAEEAVRVHHGRIPYVILRLAGLYDDTTAVPTLANQIARIYERDFQSHLYPGDKRAGQAFLHRDDMIDAFLRVIDRRDTLPPAAAILVGEPEAMSFEALQDRIGKLIHGEKEWGTLRIPAPVAQAGAWLQQKAEPVVPDALDAGELPFIRPFMVRMAEDHYAIDITLAQRLLGWAPRHDIRRGLGALVASLKAGPGDWYRRNKVSPPQWLAAAEQADTDPEQLRRRHERWQTHAHGSHRWTHWANIALAGWLIASPPALGYQSGWLQFSDVASGLLLGLFASLSLHPRAGWARWACAAIGCWLMLAPLVLWTQDASAYLNGTLVGMLVVAFALLWPPTPGVSPLAEMHGPTTPPGWDFSPSSWGQRLPIVVLAFVGFYISRYLAAYQLGHIDGAWDPFFDGGPDPKNGSEEIVTSYVSEAFPIPDAGLGALTYALEILTGLLGSARRWRTQPWLVVLFGMMIVPLGVVSIGFIIIQPILLGTWCALCLVGAAAMLVQIPYSLDELVATGQFLLRRQRAGQPVLRVFFTGDTDVVEGADAKRDAADRVAASDLSATALADSLRGGVGLPWNLVLCLAIGIWLMCTRLTLGAEGAMANADHVIGALVLTVTVTALAEVGRIVRWGNAVLGVALVVTSLMLGEDAVGIGAGIACGVALVALSFPRGAIRGRYGNWQAFIR